MFTKIFTIKDTKGVKNLHEAFQGLFTTYSDPEEISSIIRFLSQPAVQNSLESLMTSLAGIESETLESAAKGFEKIQPENLLKLDSFLKQLNMTFSSLVGDSGTLFSLFGGPAQTKIMEEVQKLKPYQVHILRY